MSKRIFKEEELSAQEEIDLAKKELNRLQQDEKITKQDAASSTRLASLGGIGMNDDARKNNKESKKKDAQSKKANLISYKEKIDAQQEKIKSLTDNNIKKVSGGEPTVENKIIKMAKLTKEQILRMVESNEPARMTKRELIESISHRLLNEDMNDDLRRKIESGQHDYSGHIDPETVKRMADDIVRTAKENIESRGGTANLEGAQEIMSQGLMGALQKESRHKRKLEKLAIKLVCDEYNVPEDAVDFDVEITGHPQLGGTEIQKTGLQIKKGEKNKTAPQGKTTEELKSKVTKRRFMNAMMHGAARKGQNLFNSVYKDVDDNTGEIIEKSALDELNKIDPSLSRDYSKLMAGNDFMYWALDDETIEREGQSGTHAGQVKLYVHGNPPQQGSKPKIVAKGMTFPFLLHELTKGVLELISQWGRESDEETRDYVEDQTDNLESETMDIRLGVKIWEKVLEAMDVDALPYKAQIFTQLSSLNENEFNMIVKGLLNDSEDAIEKMRDIVYDVIKENNEHEVEEAMKQFRDPEEPKGNTETPEGPDDDDDELARLLGGNKGGSNGGDEGDDPRTWTKRELESARDEALDNRDYESVALYQTIIDEKFY